MKLKLLFACICFSVMMIFLFGVSHAQNEHDSSLQQQDRQKRYVIGVEDLQYYPLWYYDRSKDEYTGFARTLLDAFAKSAGYSFEYRPYPIKRLMKTLIRGDIDFKFPDNPYWAQDVKGDAPIAYSEPAIDYIDGVFVRPDHVGKGEQSIKTLGSVLGFTPWDWLDKIHAGDVNLKEMPSFDSLIQQAVTGRVDGAYVNAAIVRYHLKVAGREDALVFDRDLPHTQSHYLLSTVKHPDIIEEFNRWMAENQDILDAMKAEFDIE